MNNNFSFSRIGALNRLYYTSERKMLLTFGFVALGLILLNYLWPIVISAAMFRTLNLDTVDAARSSLTALQVMYVIAISISMRPYFKRGVATAAILLPAKNSEKFLTIFFRTLVVNGVALMAMSIVVNAIFSLFMGSAIDWNVWFFDTLKNWGSGILLLCFIHSLFFFGATLFKRNAFLYTALCLLGVCMIIGIIVTGSIFAINPTSTLSVETKDMLEIGARCFVGLTTIVLWTLSWVRFKNIKIAS